MQQVLAKTAVKHVIIGSMGDMLGFKGVIVNFVVRRVKKMVPPFSIPGAVTFNDAVAAGRNMKFNKPKLGPDDVAFLQYTGGTTGVSKGATLLHRNILANVLQNDAWLQPALQKPPHVEQLFIVCALPLYHIFALTACFLLAMRAGGVNLLIPNPRDMPGFIKELMKYQVNSFPAVNTLYNGLLHTPGFDKVDFSKLKISNGGGMAVQRAVAEAWLKTTGCCDRRRLRPVGDLADADLQPGRPSTSSTARSACRCRRPIFRSATTTARKCRSASPAKSAPRARR